jgi:hypothetical protein
MPVKLSDLEVDLLRKLVNGEAVSVSSHQRFAWSWRASFATKRGG